MEFIVSSNLRVKETSWEKLKVVASANKRSINKEIEYLIDSAIENFEKEKGEIILNSEKTKSNE